MKYTIICFAVFMLVNQVAKAQAVKDCVVLELFTSEGCSSCPPADELADKLSAGYKGKLLVLAFHVDYWNYLGWSDPFSSSDYSNRQQQYGKLFGLNSVYTPQAGINGRFEMLGSDELKIKKTIESQLTTRNMKEVEVSTKLVPGNKVEVKCDVAITPGVVLNIALIQKKVSTNVKRGENSGRLLSHINVVRSFITKEQDTQTTHTVLLDIPKGLAPADCKVIVYVQAKSTGAVIAANEAVIATE